MDPARRRARQRVLRRLLDRGERGDLLHRVAERVDVDAKRLQHGTVQRLVLSQIDVREHRLDVLWLERRITTLTRVADPGPEQEREVVGRGATEPPAQDVQPAVGPVSGMSEPPPRVADYVPSPADLDRDRGVPALLRLAHITTPAS